MQKTFSLVIYFLTAVMILCAFNNYSTQIEPPSTQEAKRSSAIPNITSTHDNAENLIGINLRVIDGDTFVFNGQRIRLWGIDAPELHQKCALATEIVSCGIAARTVLTGILASGDVVCTTVDIDRYNRQVSKCMAGDKDVGEYLVHFGWAFDYPHFSKGYYRLYEEDAKKENTGLWKLNFDKPADWRRGSRRYN